MKFLIISHFGVLVRWRQAAQSRLRAARRRLLSKPRDALCHQEHRRLLRPTSVEAAREHPPYGLIELLMTYLLVEIWPACCHVRVHPT
jgi:hypothetical protein